MVATSVSPNPSAFPVYFWCFKNSHMTHCLLNYKFHPVEFLDQSGQVSAIGHIPIMQNKISVFTWGFVRRSLLCIKWRWTSLQIQWTIYPFFNKNSLK
jgi:hypothetical protein